MLGLEEICRNMTFKDLAGLTCEEAHDIIKAWIIEDDDSAVAMSPLLQSPRSAPSSSVGAYLLKQSGLSNVYRRATSPAVTSYITNALHVASYPVRLSAHIGSSVKSRAVEASTKTIALATTGYLAVTPKAAQDVIETCVGVASVNANNTINRSLREAASRRDCAVELVKTGLRDLHNLSFYIRTGHESHNASLDTAHSIPDEVVDNVGIGSGDDSGGGASGLLDTLKGYAPAFIRAPVKSLALFMFGA
jgi:hypothetical protein